MDGGVGVSSGLVSIWILELLELDPTLRTITWEDSVVF